MTTSHEASTPKNSQLTRSTLKFPVVGIGASAGGLTALLTLFEHMPSDCGMAFVVIMHLSPKHESNVDKILQNVTRMPVLQVTQPVPIERNHIYVIPPAMDLSMNDGYLRLAKPERERGAQVAIDLFFRALADVHHTHAMGIVLSGTGADGSVGLARIKEQGGVTLAQTPEDAEYDSMPRNAIETGMVDIVLPVADMPERLVELRRNQEVLLNRRTRSRRRATPNRPTRTRANWNPPRPIRNPNPTNWRCARFSLHSGPAPDTTSVITNRPRCCAASSVACRSMPCATCPATPSTCKATRKKRRPCWPTC
tara:strand:+ start:386 stop:1315 length:930 start_codon:yes stop_codon:yes gene_type:complete